jgi:hypothetical protein
MSHAIKDPVRGCGVKAGFQSRTSSACSRPALAGMAEAIMQATFAVFRRRQPGLCRYARIKQIMQGDRRQRDAVVPKASLPDMSSGIVLSCGEDDV